MKIISLFLSFDSFLIFFHLRVSTRNQPGNHRRENQVVIKFRSIIGRCSCDGLENNVKITRVFTSKILHTHGEMVEHFSRYFIDISSSCIQSILSIDRFHFSPQLIDIKQMYRCSNRTNLVHAFEFAQKHYGITQLIDPEGLSNQRQ